MSTGNTSSKRERTRSSLLVAMQKCLLDPSSEGVSVSSVTRRADVAHGTFYNHFDSLDEALDCVGMLVLAEHARLLALAVADAKTAAEVFAVSTRQTLRMVVDAPDYGHLLFDCGLPVDRLAAGMGARMRNDVSHGAAAGGFRVNNVDVATSVLSGAVLGLSLDLHRGRIRPDAIEPATQQLLQLLGVPARTAERLAHSPRQFEPPRPLPLTALTDTEMAVAG